MHASRSDENAASGRIGAELESLRQQLMSCGQVLAGLVEPASNPLVADALGRLAGLACRVAVVGQMKSGKSSVINAFVRSPGFLPTRITPATTAVTNLHFAQAPPTGYAAVFAFLDRTEWERLAEGGGRIRELTERLVPGFTPELLAEQARMLRARAEARLGPELDELLGQAHFYAGLAPGTLEQYVCADDFAGAEVLGRYADITRSADIYCGDGGPFAFPATLVDTPGTNDPFLIRDEITRRSLGTADVALVVLTASQPLSESDVSLLRIMRGLNKDRIVVLINRIDDLGDLEHELPQVVAYVEERLAAEFPEQHIPVVYGSAWWAIQALALDPHAAARILARRSAGYLLRAGLVQPRELDPAALASPDFRERLRQSLLAMSGLPAIGQAVEALMRRARPAYTLHKIAHSFAEMARACTTAARGELQMLLAAEAEARAAVPRHDATRAAYARERDLLAGVAADIEASASGIEAQLARIIEEEREALGHVLKATVETHAGRERDVLIDALSRGRPPRVWTHEGVELRRALETAFRDQFEKAAWRLTSFHARVVPELHKLMRVLIPEPDLAAPESEPMTIPAPTVAPLARLLVLDLRNAGWSAFFSRQPSPESSGAKIEQLIRAEFTPIAEELVQLAVNAFHEFSTTTIGWSFGACRNIQRALERRIALLLADDAPGSGRPDAADTLSARVRAQAERLEATEVMTQHLEHLARALDTILKPEAPDVHE